MSEQPDDDAAKPGDRAVDYEQLKDSISAMSAIIDTGLSQYEVEWQRVSTMQQSAGVLIAGLTIVVSSLLGFLSLDTSSRLVSDRAYLNDIVYPTIYVALSFVAMAMVYFFFVIWPRKVKGLPHPRHLASQMTHGDLWRNLATIIARTEGSVTDIHKHVERKQRFYLRSLYLFAASVILTGFVVLLLLIKVSALSTVKLYYWGALIVATIVYWLFVLNAKGDGDVHG